MWRDDALLLDIVISATDAMDFMAGLDKGRFIDSRLHQNAVIRCLEVIGEAANKLSPEIRAVHPDVPWGDMIGMRNRLIHAYNEVQVDIVWQVVSDRLPELVARIRPLLPPEEA